MDSQNTYSQLSHAQFSAWSVIRTADVFVCRKWELTNSFGKHIGTGYLFSNTLGDVIQGEARSGDPTSLICCLDVGHAYHLQNFRVLPISTSLCFSRDATTSLEVDGQTTVQEITCNLGSFLRFPLSPVAIEDICYTEGKYLIDVLGMVCDIGVSRPTKNGSFIVDCSIHGTAGTSIRLTLWNGSAGALLHQQQENPSSMVFVFAGLSVKQFKGELYLSTTQATTMYNAEKFPSAHATFMSAYWASQSRIANEPQVIDVSPDVSLTQMLYMGRALHYKQMNDSVSLCCKVKVQRIRTDSPWFELTCPLAYCQKGVIPVDGVYWCTSCEVLCHYAHPAFRLHLDVTDGVSVVTVGILNDVAENLLGEKATSVIASAGADVDTMTHPPQVLALLDTYHTLDLQSHTYYDYGTHESFTCNRVIAPTVGELATVGEGALGIQNPED